MSAKNGLYIETFIWEKKGEEDDGGLAIYPMKIEKTDLDELRLDISKVGDGTLWVSLDHLKQAIRIAEERYDNE